MEKIWKTSLSCVILAFMCTLALHAQSYGKQSSKEVIIIEKVKDENGNIISKKIIRSSDGDMTDEEVERALEEANDQSPFGNGNFDFGNMDFFKNSPSSDKATLGVVLSFETEEAVITEIARGSGAEEAELMVGDIIISVDGLVVNTIDDIKEYISNKSQQDQVLLSIVRDGQSFEKKVTLKKNNFNSPFGNFDPSAMKSFGQMFDLGEGNMPFDIDSLFKGIGGFDFGESPLQQGLPNYSDRDVLEDKPSLGVFIDETEGGVLIAEVLEDSPAEKANLRTNDKIIEIDGNKINSFEDLSRIVRAARKNTKLMITFIRDGKTKEAEVTLGQVD